MLKSLFLCLIICILLINRHESIDWEIYIEGREIKRASKGIDSLKGLEKYSFLINIDLRYNIIANINALKSFTNLTELKLDGNKM